MSQKSEGFDIQYLIKNKYFDFAQNVRLSSHYQPPPAFVSLSTVTLWIFHRAATAKYHRTDGKHLKSLSYGLGVSKFHMQVSVGLNPSESPRKNRPHTSPLTSGVLPHLLVIFAEKKQYPNFFFCLHLVFGCTLLALHKTFSKMVPFELSQPLPTLQ